MIKYSNYHLLLLLLLFIFLNSLIVKSQDSNIIFVDYNTQKNYSAPDQCGEKESPCISLEDAGKRAILNSNIYSNSTISIIGDINGSTSASFGNLYDYCGALIITSINNDSLIDGSNSKTPFISIEEEQFKPCANKRYIVIKYLNFINWDQTIIKVNINHETNQTIIDPSKSLFFNIFYVNMTSLNSIFSIYPKNIGDILNLEATSISIGVGVLFEKLKSTSTLFVPNSTTDYLPPIYLVGAKISGLPTSIKDSNFTTTPFIYVNGAIISIFSSSTIINNNICSPFLMITSSTLDWGGSLAFNNSRFKTMVYISKNQQRSSIGKLTINNNDYLQTGGDCHNNKFLNNQFYNDSLIVIKDTINSSFDSFYIIPSKPTPIHISLLNNDRITISNVQGDNCHFNITNSSVQFDYDLTMKHSVITGSNSTMYLTKNDTMCSCPGCIYIYGNQPAITQDCSAPTQTPTDLNMTNKPTLTPSSSSSSSPTKSNSVRNIIVIIVILGSASIASLVLFSFIYKRYKNKKYILNSISSSNTSSEDGDLAGAAADNDVSPNLEATTPFEDDDCAQLEQI
ncbi:hypothetical protein RB653_000623 [Dictyostelium firmibasis]|uniref:Transmembrane protein n=1 Tax=Dictyostelium firmibasis TaxID=79012 RepID=A0AAN7U3L9_9MYCE